MSQQVIVEEVAPEGFEAVLPGLAEVLHGCVQGGASVGFVLPFGLEDAAAFWRSLAPGFAAGARLLLVARLDGRIVGTAQLVLAMPANGAHRAEVAKVLVHPDARRRGIARVLMLAAEAAARRRGRRLLLLDTSTGRAAEQLYHGLGYTVAGVVPGYAMDPDGSSGATTFMFKELADG